MEKLTYLLCRGTDTSGAALRTTLIEKVAPVLREAGALQICLSVDDEDVAVGDAVRIRRNDPPTRALVSFWMNNSDDRAPCEAALAGEAEQLSGYLVVESRPLLHEPPLGERAPGANLVTCIRRKPGLSDAEFIDRWNNEHKRVALETQSTTAYVRNAVVRKLTATGPDWDGIVEETFPVEALTNPHAWYDCDSAAEYERRLQRMMDSVKAFLDLTQLDSTPMSEYYLG